MDERRVRALVKGRVQGVFFRAGINNLAEDLGLSGWVRNTPEGHVETELQGDPGAVEKALRFCHKGPAGAEVTHVSVEDREPSAQAAGFEVR